MQLLDQQKEGVACGWAHTLKFSPPPHLFDPFFFLGKNHDPGPVLPLTCTCGVTHLRKNACQDSINLELRWVQQNATQHG